MTLDELAWDDEGLVAVTIVDARDNSVLTLAYANRDAVEATMRTGATHLWSRSRKTLWHKGGTSGNTQRVISIDVDCDGDALVYRVIPDGPACHTGNTSCFYRNLWTADDASIVASIEAPSPPDFERAIRHLVAVIEERRGASPETSYVAKMLARGVDGIAKKIGEEATEVVIAAKNDDRGELIWEAADLIFHTLVMLAQRNVNVDEVGRELLRRAAR
ncbi:MAG TPA: bifunctional phosphoribosyl-AMP cyclohydrolase/phosphoribosyl-ATP diphosphatase HisIE [Candidatus Binatia bacterium]|nr:bifunctional phosphoribosyl-AMP cyclohydrolase/phosphoribosyl-ATP diphosphatase HisIE [Candidatus Binatia bacterium]